MAVEEIQLRKHFVDNLRNAAILLLFPVHTFMIWNDFGSGFYIWVKESRLLSTLIVLVNPWFMPLLFVLAGMSARYALEQRTVKEFVGQRVKKLLLPFLFGMLFLVPFQALYARKYFENYNGGILGHYKYFFTHLTDFSGYDGAFTPGHLWFILFLFLISMITLPLFRYLPYEKAKPRVEKLSSLGALLLFLVIGLMYPIGNFGGFSIGKDLALYLIGYYVVSNDVVLEKIEKAIKWLTGLCIVGTICLVLFYYQFAYYGDLWVHYIGWNTILVLLIFGKKIWNKRTKFTEYFNRASYPLYILHQSVLVALAYYVVKVSDIMAAQLLVICFGSFGLTVLFYELYWKMRLVRRTIWKQ